MKTLIIYNSFEDMAKFAIVDGDYSELEDTVINSTEDQEKQDKLMALLYPNGRDLIPMMTKLPKDGWDISINVGFAP